MENVIQIQVRTVYGVMQAYPVNEQAKLLAQIAGTKTLQHATLAYAERMGFQIEQVQQAAFYQCAEEGAAQRFAARGEA
jgi:hypothetical protein